MRKLFAVLLSLSLLLPAAVFASDQDMLQKIEALSKELDGLKRQMNETQNKESAKETRIVKMEEKAQEAEKPSWLEIGGDYRARFDNLKGKTHDALTLWGPVTGGDVTNDALLTNRFGLNLKAKATEDVSVKARLVMYKVWGHEDSSPVTGSNSYFADKSSIFDGNITHTPSDNTLRVDQAYATWTNMFNVPLWFSVGRRPSTGGVPTNLRQNVEKVGNAGTPGMMIDYAFDGATLGWAPDIDALPGAYAKLCYGRGFDSGFRPSNGNMNDVNFVGINLVPYDTDKLHLELQWSEGFSIFAFPQGMSSTFNGTIMPAPVGPNVTLNNTNLGDISQIGGLATTKIDKLGPGDLNLFVSGASSKTHPNENSLLNTYGLNWDAVDGKKSTTGYGYYLGGRYDIKTTGTKLGAEYNHGSKNWITFAPASDDMFTSKLGTRGDVYEVYLIQELNKKPISKKGNAFFRLGYQYYDFQYTNSNNWVGGPHKISDLTMGSPAAPLFFAPLKNAKDIYLTFDVAF